MKTAIIILTAIVIICICIILVYDFINKSLREELLDMKEEVAYYKNLSETYGQGLDKLKEKWKP